MLRHNTCTVLNLVVITIMEYFLLVCTILSIVIVSSFGKESDLEIIKKVNAAHTTWKAAENHLTRLSDKDKLHLVGSKLELSNVRELRIHPNGLLGRTKIPKTFDARKKWRQCPSIGYIKDQGLCSGCWAVSSASVMSDRLCIASNHKIKVNISSEDIISCCYECGRPQGCSGGNVENAWLYFNRVGVVTGGDYGSNEGCKPFSTVNCGNNCTGTGSFPTPQCLKHLCTNSRYHKTYKKDLHFGTGVYTVPMNVTNIQLEIFHHGPVVASYNIYQDFYSYKSGVYQFVTGKFHGGHSVKLIGWGTEKGTDYWLAANSWGSDWGEKGLFKIRRGTNEAYFEQFVVAGTVIPK